MDGNVRNPHRVVSRWLWNSVIIQVYLISVWRHLNLQLTVVWLLYYSKMILPFLFKVIDMLPVVFKILIWKGTYDHACVRWPHFFKGGHVYCVGHWTDYQGAERFHNLVMLWVLWHHTPRLAQVFVVYTPYRLTVQEAGPPGLCKHTPMCAQWWNHATVPLLES